MTIPHWHLLTLIIPSTLIDGCEHVMSAETLSEVRAEAAQFDGLLATAVKGGMTFTHTVIESDQPLTTRTAVWWAPGYWYVEWGDVQGVMGALGLNHDDYDTVVSFVSNTCVGIYAEGGGITNIDIPVVGGPDRPGGSSVVYMPPSGPIGDNVMLHEWMHQITRYFNYWHHIEPYIDIDHPELYVALDTGQDYDPYTSDVMTTIPNDILGGNLALKSAPQTQVGITAADWALGSPRDLMREETRRRRREAPSSARTAASSAPSWHEPPAQSRSAASHAARRSRSSGERVLR